MKDNPYCHENNNKLTTHNMEIYPHQTEGSQSSNFKDLLHSYGEEHLLYDEEQ